MKKTRMILGAIVLWSILVSVVLAETKVIATEGKFVMGDLDNKQDAKQMALLEAKRAALDAAGTYLTSTSVVKNYTLSEDQISSLAAGIVAVTVLDEQWKMAGEAPVVVVKIQAIIDTENLEEQVQQHLENGELSANVQELENEIETLRRQITQLQEAPSEPSSSTASASPEKVAQRREAMKKLIVYDKLKAAQIAMNQHQTGPAIQALSMLIKKDKALAPAYFLRARAYEKSGRRLLARRDLQRACQLGLQKACDMVKPPQKSGDRPKKPAGSRLLRR